YELWALTGQYPRRMPAAAGADPDTPTALPLRCWVLEGKTVRGDQLTGEVIALGPRRLAVRLDAPLQPLTNLRLRLRYPALNQDSADVYGKVLAAEEANGTPLARIGLTWVDAVDQQILNGLMRGGGSSRP